MRMGFLRTPTIFLIKALWAITGVHIQPENWVLIAHVGTNLATGIITRYLRVPLSLADLAHNFRVKELDNRVTPDIKPKKVD